MKIYEIISERKIEEASLIGGAAKWLMTHWSAGNFIELLSKNENLMARFANGTPPSIAEIERLYGRKAADLVRADDTILSKAAAKRAEKVSANTAATQAARDAHEVNLARVAQGSGAGGGSANPLVSNIVSTTAGRMRGTFGKLPAIASGLKNFLLAYEFYSYIKDYRDTVAYWEDQLAKGNIKETDYNQYRQRAMTHVMTQISLALVGNASILTVGAFLKSWCVFGWMSPIRTLIGGLSGASQIAFMSWLGSDPGRAYLAQTLMYNEIDPYWGALGVTGVENIKDQLNRMRGKQTNKPSQDDEEGQGNKPRRDDTDQGGTTKKQDDQGGTTKKDDQGGTTKKDDEDSLGGLLGGAISGDGPASPGGLRDRAKY